MATRDLLRVFKKRAMYSGGLVPGSNFVCRRDRVYRGVLYFTRLTDMSITEYEQLIRIYSVGGKTWSLLLEGMVAVINRLHDVPVTCWPGTSGSGRRRGSGQHPPPRPVVAGWRGGGVANEAR